MILLNINAKNISLLTLFVTASGFFIQNYYLSSKYGFMDFNVLNTKMIYSGTAFVAIILLSLFCVIGFTDCIKVELVSWKRLFWEAVVRMFVLCNTIIFVSSYIDFIDINHIENGFIFHIIIGLVMQFWITKLVHFSGLPEKSSKLDKLFSDIEIIIEVVIVFASLFVFEYCNYREVFWFSATIALGIFSCKTAIKARYLDDLNGISPSARPTFFSNNALASNESQFLDKVSNIVLIVFLFSLILGSYIRNIYPNLPQRYGGANSSSLLIESNDGNYYYGKIINQSEGIYYVDVNGKIFLLKNSEIKMIKR